MSVLSRLIIMLGLVSALAACGPKPRLSPSFWAEGAPAGAAALVAGDLAGSLAAAYPPGRTTIHLNQTDLEQDELGPALETALRARGFSLAPVDGGGILTVSYVLDRLADENAWYVKLTVSDGLTLARVYQPEGDNLTPKAATRTGRMEKNHE
jgi:hypothetical protein